MFYDKLQSRKKNFPFFNGKTLKAYKNYFNPLSASTTNWSNTLKQFLGKSRQVV